MTVDVATAYNTHKNFIYRLALSYVRSSAEAEDILQETFIRYMDNRKKVYPGKERMWLASVAVNLCKNRLKALARESGEWDPDWNVEFPEKSELFYAVMALPEHERIVIHLHYFEGYDTREIAGILRISQTAVTSRLSRARKHLKERLEGEVYV